MVEKNKITLCVSWLRIFLYSLLVIVSFKISTGSDMNDAT